MTEDAFVSAIAVRARSSRDRLDDGTAPDDLKTRAIDTLPIPRPTGAWGPWDRDFRASPRLFVSCHVDRWTGLSGGTLPCETS